jgi:hypothetical protein
MAYYVTFETFNSSNKPLPVGIDAGPLPEGFNLDDALAHARMLLSEGNQHATISDGAGHSISGDDLVACCVGKKILTADLKAN